LTRPPSEVKLAVVEEKLRWLDRVIIFDERHLLRLLREYVRYHHDDRTHLGLAKETPARRSVERRPSAEAKVVALPRAGGLHHRYAWREAA